MSINNVTEFDSIVAAEGFIPDNSGDGDRSESSGGLHIYVGNSTSYVPVDGIAASDLNSGLSPQERLSTISAAHAKVVSGRGDIIHVLPGHSETLTSAFEITKNNVTILGEGNEFTAPLFSASADVGIFNVTGNSFKLEGVTFGDSTGSSNVALAVSSGAFEINNCNFLFSNGGGNTIGVSVTGVTAAGFIKNCIFLCANATAASAISIASDGETYIRGNTFKATSGAVSFSAATVINAGGASTNIICQNNIHINPKTTVAVVDVGTSAYAVVTGNSVINGSDATTFIGRGLIYRNYVSRSTVFDEAPICANKFRDDSTTLSYASSASENTIYSANISSALHLRLERFVVVTVNCTQNGTIRLYETISGTERLIKTVGFLAPAVVTTLIDTPLSTQNPIRVSFQSAVAEGATRSIPLSILLS